MSTRGSKAAAFLFGGTSTGWAVAASIVLFAGYLLFGIGNRRLDGPWRVDEGQRIAEGYFWRLIRAGDISNPDWFSARYIRSNPPVSKYFYGAVVSIAGVPAPRDLALPRAYAHGFPADRVPERFLGDYLPRLRPARMASFLCNALSAAIVFVVALRLQGLLAAALTQLLLLRHYLFSTVLFYARSDTLQTLWATTTIVALLVCATAARTWLAAIAAGMAGALAALAFQTRLDGGVVLLMCLAFLVARSPRDRRTVVSAAAVVLVFALVSLAIYPLYWANPRPAPDVPAVVLAHEALPSRVAHRFALEVSDLAFLAAEIEPKWHIDSLPQRLRFTLSVLASGKAGLLNLAGCCLALALLPKLSPNERAIVAWALAGVAVMGLWIPLRWDVYLLIVLPAWVVTGAIGLSAALKAISMRQWRRE